MALHLKLKSPAFSNEQFIPEHYTSSGESVSPPLHWSGVPEGTREFALICEDPDAPFPQPFVHWIIYGISANTTFLPQGLPGEEQMLTPVFAWQGLNSMATVGYTGPNPPIWHHAHRYIFRLFALNAPLAIKPRPGRDAFWKALAGHVIQEAQLIGLYEKRTAQKIRGGLQLLAGLSAATVGIAVLLKQRKSA